MLLETQSFEFGEFLLNAKERVLIRNGKPLSVTPKAFQLLLVLVENHGRLVEKDELMKAVWADSFVEEGNLTYTIRLLRQALGDDANNPRFIETVSKGGYRFITEVRRVAAKSEIPEVKDESVTPPLNGKNVSPLIFPHSINQSAIKSSGAVVALADWRHETEKNQPEESNGQSAELKLAPTNPIIESKPKYHAFVLAALLVGAIGLGYYFFYERKTVSSTDGKKSIAVLPLKPINTANRDELYEAGIADSLILKLSSMKGLVVRPLSATRKYTDIGQDPLTAGKEQQVDYVLASNYQLAGGKIRVTAQLFNVANGQIEETYKSEKEAGDVFAMQDAIAGEVGNILSARFATTSSSPTAKRGMTNEEAYRLYLQGRNLTARRSPADARKAIEYFEQAIRLDPNYALAYAGMADSYIAVFILGGGLPHEENKKAKAAVTKALELDNNLAEGYRVLAVIKQYEWDFAGAEKAWLRAAELEPHSVLGHEFGAGYLSYRGRFDEAIAKTEAALEIDPNSLGLQRDRGRILYLARRYDEAIVQLKRVIELDAAFLTTYSWLWLAYHLKGDHAGAYEWFLKYHQQRKVSPERIDLYQNAYRTLGWRGVLQKQVEIHKLDEQGDAGDHPTNYKVGLLSALLGEKDQAIAYLNKSFEQRNGQMIMLNVEPAFDNLRGDPRFAELVKRVGLPQ